MRNNHVMRGLLIIMLALSFEHQEKALPLVEKYRDDGQIFRHLMSGESKREALVNAQKELRSLGYTDSDYWATFILLDAF